MKVNSVFDREFRQYGQVLEGYDYQELFEKLQETEVPEKGILYRASVPELESCEVSAEFRERGFGGMPVELGYCNGTNDTLNCLEYHKSSEFNIAEDDIVLLLGLQCDIEDGIYDTSRVKAFLVPAGTGVELYATTLHYAPCGYRGEGFRVVCVLPRGTNIGGPKPAGSGIEAKMCRGTNKWLLSHPESDEAQDGAYAGLTGENLKYICQEV